MAMKTISIEGIRINYADEGQGLPIIFAHCSSASHRLWRALIDDLKSTYRVIAPDLIGYGSSGKWPPGRAFDFGADAQILVELARMAGEPVHFVGHSYGGAMVLEAVLRLGGEARAMTLIEPVAFPLLRAHGRLEEWRMVEKVADNVNQAISQGDGKAAAAAYMRFWLGRLKWWLLPQKLKDNVIETVEKVALEFEAAKHTVSPSSELIKSIDAPTLLVYGSRTRKPAKAVIELLCNLLPNSKTEIIHGAGHMSPITHRDRVNAVIKAHIDKCAPLPGAAAQSSARGV